MDTCRGIGGSELLTLGHHRQNTAVDGGGAGIDGHPRALEDLREVLGHAASDAVMLTFTHSAQVTQTELCSSIFPVEGGEVRLRQGGKLLYQPQRLLAFGSQFACLAGLL